ncbi:hypothetical protein N2152v2_002905 [Parachlorella kessleri]
MVLTRRSSALQRTFPLFHALIVGDAACIVATCTPQEAAKCGPGNLSALMLAILLDRDPFVPQLIAAQVPLDTTLTHSYSEAQVQKWLAAAQLTDRGLLRFELVAGRSALDIALSLGKAQVASILVAAGAGMQPFLFYRRFAQYKYEAIMLVREQVMQYALAHWWSRGLCGVPATLLGQLALLALQLGHLEHCLTTLQAAAQRSVQLSSAEADAILQQAATKGHVSIALHVAQHSPGIAWDLLARGYITYCPTVAAALFPYLAQRYRQGRFNPPHGGYLRLLVLRALHADQPGAALTVLHAVEAQQLQLQPQEESQQRLQRQPTLSASCLSELLMFASAQDFLDVVLQLLQMGADIWPLLAQLPPTAGFEAMDEFMPPTVAAVLLSQLVERYAAGSLQVSDSKQLALLLRWLCLSNQVVACLMALDIAATRQLFLRADEAATVLKAAAEQGHPALIFHLARQFGLEALWQVLQPSWHPRRNVVYVVMVQLAGQLVTGAMQLNSIRLGQLLETMAMFPEVQFSTALLEAIAQQQVRLTNEGTYEALFTCVELAGSAQLAKVVLTVGAPLSSSQASSLAQRAANSDQSALLELLLTAGAVVDTQLANTVVQSLSLACLTLLLKLGPLPVDRSSVWTKGWIRQYTCPILHLLEEQSVSGSSAQRQQFAAPGSRSTETESHPSSKTLLAQLPTELLLHIMHLAARPLSAWLAMEEDD